MTAIKWVLCATILALTICCAPDDPRTTNEHDGASIGNESLPIDTVVSSQYSDVLPAAKTVNVYVENSGSMYGYVGVGPGSDFRNMVYNYLADVKIAGIFDSINLYFINSKVKFVGADVDDFVKKLNPNTFKLTGGNAGATDISEIIKRVFPKEGNVSILVSDCIISPGKGHNASEYLINQQIGIKSFLAQSPKFAQTGVIIYRMLGQFKGNYYDTVDNKRRYEGERPYYVWVMGDVATLKQLRQIVESKMKTRPDELCVVTAGISMLNYYIVPGSGAFQLDRANPKTSITKVKKIKTPDGNRVVFKLNVDYSRLLQDDDYLADVANYEVSNPMFRVDKVQKMQNNRYTITVSSAVAKPCTISVRLKNKPPQWVNSCSDTDGGFPDPKNPHQTTYGLSYLIGGVFDAYTYNSDNLAEMRVTIK